MIALLVSVVAHAAGLGDVPLVDLADALPTLAAAPLSDRWEDRLRTGALAAWSADPDRASDVLSAPPRPTRAGFDRVSVGAIDDPTWWLLAARAAGDGPDRDAVTRTLVAVRPVDSGVLAGLYHREADPVVRVLLVAAFDDGDDPVGAPVVARALDDADASVRAEAARIAGDRGDPALVPALLRRTSDPSPVVRELAIGALRHLRPAGAFDALRPHLDDPHPDVRFAATAALRALDPARFVDLPEIRALAADPDPRVRALLPPGAAPALP